jgi:hypothetical protein
MSLVETVHENQVYATYMPYPDPENLKYSNSFSFLHCEKKGTKKFFFGTYSYIITENSKS